MVIKQKGVNRSKKSSESVVLAVDFLETIGGGVMFFLKLVSAYKVDTIYTLVAKKQFLANYLQDKKVYFTSNWFIRFLYQKVPKFGKLFYLFLNISASSYYKKIGESNRLLINSSSFMPVKKIKAVVYYHIFPFWYSGTPRSYLTNMPFLFRFLFNLVMIKYQEKIYRNISYNGFRIMSNSSKTGFLFYKYWQKHSYVFLPLLAGDEFDFNVHDKEVKDVVDQIKENKCYVYTGRLDKGKRLDILIKVLPSDVCFMFIGNGPWAKELQKLGQRLGKKLIFTLKWFGYKKIGYFIYYSKGIINLADESFGLLYIDAFKLEKVVLGSILSGLYDIAVINKHFVDFTISNRIFFEHEEQFLQEARTDFKEKLKMLEKLSKNYEASKSKFGYNIIYKQLKSEYTIDNFKKVHNVLSN